MAGSEMDPLGAEPQAILGAADFNNARVLEIGSGDGRLTFRYARKSLSAVGIDLKQPEILSAVRNCSADLRSRVRFARASAATLPFRDEVFDIVLLASAL